MSLVLRLPSMKRHIVSFLIILVALVGLGYLIVRPESSQKLAQNSTAVSPLLTTERWIGLNGYPGGMSLRAVGGNPDLLLKHNNAEIIYRFSPADKQLRSVNADTWNNAQGEVIDCNGQVEKEPWRMRIDRETNKLFIDGKEVNGIKGKVHLRYQFTSRRRQIRCPFGQRK